MKLFGWSRYKISDTERAESEAALVHAQEIAAKALEIKGEAQRVGDRQRQLRQENGFGMKLTHVFRNA
jgi:hypothetical protein